MGAVVFISCPPKIPNAVYGGLMSTRARALCAEGSVIDGRFRDVQEQRDLAYPVKNPHIYQQPPGSCISTSIIVKFEG
jgi:regulator of RNase E activity RraA